MGLRVLQSCWSPDLFRRGAPGRSERQCGQCRVGGGLHVPLRTSNCGTVGHITRVVEGGSSRSRVC
eukprot:3594425-Prorocentrum_lima.AAC.1